MQETASNKKKIKIQSSKAHQEAYDVILAHELRKFSYQKASFLKSTAKAADLPDDIGTEVAFAGRSNSGKSSAINTITQQTKLARTSKTPGRTQLINFFELEADVRLVDLPGYGYAKVADRVKKEWEEHLQAYIGNRRCLQGIIVTMDIRHPLTRFDWQMLDWSLHHGHRIHILLNKADKLKRNAQNVTLTQVRKELSGYEDYVTVQLFSSLNRSGVEEARQHMDKWLSLGLSEEDEACP